MCCVGGVCVLTQMSGEELEQFSIELASYVRRKRVCVCVMCGWHPINVKCDVGGMDSV